MVYTHCMIFVFNVTFCVLQDAKFVNMVLAFHAAKDSFWMKPPINVFLYVGMDM